MLKPIRWNTFIRDFIVIQIGFMLYGLALALIVRQILGPGHGWCSRLPWPISSGSKSGR